jgi:NAD(P)-dependent dehydrogenase (short-subunit alcohol dehydrogenase family)
MLLENKNAVIYGAGGDVGSAVARTFARSGARVFLVGRTLGPLEAVAEEITQGGGLAEVRRWMRSMGRRLSSIWTRWYRRRGASIFLLM